MSAKLADDELLISRTFDAPASLMFELWTDPVHFKNWMGPGKYECRHAEMDLRVGGAYRGMIYADDTGEGWFGGVYREIEPNTRLVFTFKWDSGPSGELETLVTITFREERDGRTTMTFHQTPFMNVERRDSHIGGWNSAFTKFGEYVEKLARETTQ
ncbi:SRPBCC domain-containing protein [Terricaulis silvestris]|uniref:Activator of Hsp90 ATPase n=1 Tax=Terricaulis silvestris TaxID=2686094 RepID=A0A6I6MSL9_9CAUL|nr:SRPBCC domain-containing protein [Terricaulis silvestris]QGZ96338.1 Activator of Hsp90 ATPase [Terricaulis silvestris]